MKTQRVRNPSSIIRTDSDVYDDFASALYTVSLLFEKMRAVHYVGSLKTFSVIFDFPVIPAIASAYFYNAIKAVKRMRHFSCVKQI